MSVREMIAIAADRRLTEEPEPCLEPKTGPALNPKLHAAECGILARRCRNLTPAGHAALSSLLAGSAPPPSSPS